MRLQEYHKTLKNGVGKCSVPMFIQGLPAGFCDQPAYGKRPSGPIDSPLGQYQGYVPALACPLHGGPDKRS